MKNNEIQKHPFFQLLKDENNLMVNQLDKRWNSIYLATVRIYENRTIKNRLKQAEVSAFCRRVFLGLKYAL